MEEGYYSEDIDIDVDEMSEDTEDAVSEDAEE